VQHLRDLLVDPSSVQVDGVYAPPSTVALVELQLHEVAGDGGEHHVARLHADLVLELRHGVEARAA
jgi:hypothetical protein